MILAGELALWVALLMAAWAATVSFAGGAQGRADLVRSGERAVYATFGFTLVASLGLWTALFTHDFSIKFVASYTSANLPTVYLFTAFWAGQAGSPGCAATAILTIVQVGLLPASRRSSRDSSRTPRRARCSA